MGVAPKHVLSFCYAKFEYFLYLDQSMVSCGVTVVSDIYWFSDLIIKNNNQLINLRLHRFFID